MWRLNGLHMARLRKYIATGLELLMLDFITAWLFLMRYQQPSTAANGGQSPPGEKQCFSFRPTPPRKRDKLGLPTSRQGEKPTYFSVKPWTWEELQHRPPSEPT